MAVGLPLKTTYANGDVFSASDINDTNGTVNLVGQTTNFYAGKNKIINGDFGIWQRGTSTSITSNYVNVYSADRFATSKDGTGTMTVTRQTFTPGTAPVAGYEGSFFYRFNQSTAGSGSGYLSVLRQPIEDVRTFAGNTVTLSFWAKADTTRNLTANITQIFGSGGSADVAASIPSPTANLTTSWQRFTINATIPSISGKTIGTSSQLMVDLQSSTLNATQIIDIWGVQLEAGSTATAFETATGTIQGELAACQRYYWRVNVNVTNTTTGLYGSAYNTTSAAPGRGSPVTMRVAPTSVDSSNLLLNDFAGTYPVTGIALWNGSSTDTFYVLATGASGLTQGRSYGLTASGTGFIGFSAEL